MSSENPQKPPTPGQESNSETPVVERRSGLAKKLLPLLAVALVLGGAAAYLLGGEGGLLAQTPCNGGWAREGMVLSDAGNNIYVVVSVEGGEAVIARGHMLNFLGTDILGSYRRDTGRDGVTAGNVFLEYVFSEPERAADAAKLFDVRRVSLERGFQTLPPKTSDVGYCLEKALGILDLGSGEIELTHLGAQEVPEFRSSDFLVSLFLGVVIEDPEEDWYYWGKTAEVYMTTVSSPDLGGEADVYIYIDPELGLIAAVEIDADIASLVLPYTVGVYEMPDESLKAFKEALGEG